jgi:transcriptional regulator with XRE-family HTH domain
MANRVTPKKALPLYVKVWLAIRGMSAADLAAELGVSDAAVSRWISGDRQLDTRTIRAIEEILKLDPGGLHKPPEEATQNELLAGLTPDKRKEALNYIEYLRRRPE